MRVPIEDRMAEWKFGEKICMKAREWSDIRPMKLIFFPEKYVRFIFRVWKAMIDVCEENFASCENYIISQVYIKFATAKFMIEHW